jgi:hypothetical protein
MVRCNGPEKSPLLDLFVSFIFVHHNAFSTLHVLSNKITFLKTILLFYLVWFYNKPSLFVSNFH